MADFTGFKHAFVPVALESDDELALARNAITVAAKLVGKGAQVTVATVRVALEGPGDRRLLDQTALAAYRSILAGRERWAEGQLDLLAQFAREFGVVAHTKTITDEHGVAKELVQGVNKVGADVIVMPTHSRHGVERLFLGSVAQKVAHLSSIPVLLLPSTR
jgi:nucleotide-binding universal stress UspA family protein